MESKKLEALSKKLEALIPFSKKEYEEADEDLDKVMREKYPDNSFLYALEYYKIASKFHHQIQESPIFSHFKEN